VPTYEYACTSCGEQLEVVQKFTDDPLTVCPSCGSSLRKVFSPVGIVFKGSGFYRTDSRKASVATDSGGGSSSDSKTKSNGSSDSSGSSSDSGSSGSSTSKPESKSSGGDSGSSGSKKSDSKVSSPAST
jgi:putative FmdB family regulatory protein